MEMICTSNTIGAQHSSCGQWPDACNASGDKNSMSSANVDDSGSSLNSWAFHETQSSSAVSIDDSFNSSASSSRYPLHFNPSRRAFMARQPSVVRRSKHDIAGAVFSARSRLAQLVAFLNLEDSQSSLLARNGADNDSFQAELMNLRDREEEVRRELEGLWISGTVGGWRDDYWDGDDDDEGSLPSQTLELQESDRLAVKRETEVRSIPTEVFVSELQETDATAAAVIADGLSVARGRSSSAQDLVGLENFEARMEAERKGALLASSSDLGFDMVGERMTRSSSQSSLPYCSKTTAAETPASSKARPTFFKAHSPRCVADLQLGDVDSLDLTCSASRTEPNSSTKSPKRMKQIELRQKLIEMPCSFDDGHDNAGDASARESSANESSQDSRSPAPQNKRKWTRLSTVYSTSDTDNQDSRGSGRSCKSSSFAEEEPPAIKRPSPHEKIIDTSSRSLGSIQQQKVQPRSWPPSPPSPLSTEGSHSSLSELGMNFLPPFPPLEGMDESERDSEGLDDVFYDAAAGDKHEDFQRGWHHKATPMAVRGSAEDLPGVDGTDHSAEMACRSSSFVTFKRTERPGNVRTSGSLAVILERAERLAKVLYGRAELATDPGATVSPAKTVVLGFRPRCCQWVRATYQGILCINAALTDSFSVALLRARDTGALSNAILWPAAILIPPALTALMGSKAGALLPKGVEDVHVAVGIAASGWIIEQILASAVERLL